MNIDDSICCQDLPLNSAVRSPFGKIISLGFYDGTTSGVAQCSRCSRSYRYELVAWDSGQDLRIYSLASLPQRSFDALVRLLSGATSPTWPIWMPELPSDPAREVTELSRAIDAELAEANPPDRVVASRHIDKEILASRNLTEAARVKLPTGGEYPNMLGWDYWCEYLAMDSLPESIG